MNEIVVYVASVAVIVALGYAWLGKNKQAGRLAAAAALAIRAAVVFTGTEARFVGWASLAVAAMFAVDYAKGRTAAAKQVAA